MRILPVTMTDTKNQATQYPFQASVSEVLSLVIKKPGWGAYLYDAEFLSDP